MSAHPLPVVDQPVRRAPLERLLHRIDMPGPSYCSYPSTDHFQDHYGADTALGAITTAAHRAQLHRGLPLSVCVNLPQGESACGVPGRGPTASPHAQAEAYLEAIQTELSVVRRALGDVFAHVSQLHVGGSLALFTATQFERLMAALGSTFRLAVHAGMSVDLNPGTATAARLVHLRRLGFAGLCLGGPDIDAHLSRAANRLGAFGSLPSLMRYARGLDFESISIGIVYGRPQQSVEMFSRAVAFVGELRPDCIVLQRYARAHDGSEPPRPSFDLELPDSRQRIAMLDAALSTLGDAGYQGMGMGHFVLDHGVPAQELARNRMPGHWPSYRLNSDRDVIGVGLSATSRLGDTCHQNTSDVNRYIEDLAQGRLPVTRGLKLDRDDQARRTVIDALLGLGRVDFAALRRRHAMDLCGHFSRELAALQPMAREGLLIIGSQSINLTAKGRLAVQSVVGVFDRYLRDSNSAPTWCWQ